MNKIIKKVFDIFYPQEVFLVGGSVRDQLLGRKTNDLDFATPLKPKQIINILENHNMKYKLVGKRFGVIIAEIEGTNEGEAGGVKVEIATFRKKETYGESRKPEVEFGINLRQDLVRRDFTCNALAANNHGHVSDYVGGNYDIKHKEIRLVKLDKSIFDDDPLRMLRACRFASQLDFTIESETKEIIKDSAHKIINISRERWKIEMDKLLMTDKPSIGLNYIMELGLMKWLIPELINIKNMTQPKEHHHKDVLSHTFFAVDRAHKDLNIKWTLLLHDIGKAYTRTIEDGVIHFYKHEIISELLAEGILDRFKFSNKDKKEILFLIKNHMRVSLYNYKWSKSAVRRLYFNCEEYIDKMIKVSMADITSSRPHKIQECLDSIGELSKRIEEVKNEKKEKPLLPSGIGNAIMDEFYVEQGPKVGEIKKYLIKEIIEGNIKAGKSKKYYTDFLYNIQILAI